MAGPLKRYLFLQYIDMEDPKAALAKTLNQTTLTQDGALAAMDGISPVLTQGVRKHRHAVLDRPLCLYW